RAVRLRVGPGLLRPALGAVGARALPRRVPQDAAEPVVGRRLQPAGRAARRGGARPDRLRAADERGGAADVRLDRGGGAERAAAAPAGPAPAGQRREDARPARPLSRSAAEEGAQVKWCRSPCGWTAALRPRAASW